MQHRTLHYCYVLAFWLTYPAQKHENCMLTTAEIWLRAYPALKACREIARGGIGDVLELGVRYRLGPVQGWQISQGRPALR